MYVIQVESSWQRGMGHFYRALNIIEYARKKGEKGIILINDDLKAINLLIEKDIDFIKANYDDLNDVRIEEIIDKNKINVWIMDRFQTNIEICKCIKKRNVLLVGIDDKGEGAQYFDLHFASLLFQNVRGKNIYFGKDFLILNPEIKRFFRIRTQLKKIIVSLGGSDTYGVTLKVIEILKEKGYSADIVLGPNFSYFDELRNIIDERYHVYHTVPSLVKMFNEYDLAITGGGITCCEANASGLPCIIIANEDHEILIGEYVEKYGGAIFAGYHSQIKREKFMLDSINIKEMSLAAGRAFTLDGLSNIYKIVKEYMKEGK